MSIPHSAISALRLSRGRRQAAVTYVNHVGISPRQHPTRAVALLRGHPKDHRRWQDSDSLFNGGTIAAADGFVAVMRFATGEPP